MAFPANYFVTKTQATFSLAGKWSMKSVLDRIAQLKRGLKESYLRGFGKQKEELKVDVIPPRNVDATKSVREPLLWHHHFPLQAYKSTLRGYACKVFNQMSARSGSHAGCSGPFRRDFLWRRMRTGHLVGFATLFLVHEENTAEENLAKKRMHEYERLCENIKATFSPEIQRGEICETLGNRLEDFKLGKCIAVGCNGAVYEAELEEHQTENKVLANSPLPRKSTLPHQKSAKGRRIGHKEKKKLAVKMIFNFDSSNAGVIHRLTQSELITCGRGAMSSLSKDWQNGSRVRMKRLPSHPNIIRVQKAVIGKIPEHPEFSHRHPATLPPPMGYGRTSTMFLFMKRYSSTLDDCLKSKDLPDVARYLLCLQLLQGAAHLERNKVAHRDLKANNILIEYDSVHLPRLVISDFGCSLTSDSGKELVFPFHSSQYDIRNGTASFQPPEITQCYPSPDSYLDYRKSDAWAVGLLLRDIVAFPDDDRSQKNEEVHELLQKLIILLLQEDKNKRISCLTASNVLHFEMFGPKLQECQENIAKEKLEALSNWLLVHASETIAYKTTEWGKDSVVCDIFSNLLSSVSSADLTDALDMWLSLKKM